MIFLVSGMDESAQLVDQAAAVATVLGELDRHRSEPVQITLPEGPGFAESLAGASRERHIHRVPELALVLPRSSHPAAVGRSRGLVRRWRVRRRAWVGRLVGGVLGQRVSRGRRGCAGPVMITKGAENTACQSTGP